MKYFRSKIQPEYISLRKLSPTDDDSKEDKTAAKERRLKLCSSLDNKALVVFPAANLLFNIVFWAYFLS